jgi:hypothetical protein
MSANDCAVDMELWFGVECAWGDVEWRGAKLSSQDYDSRPTRTRHFGC